MTAYGTAEVTLEGTPSPGLLLVLTHGSGGGVESPDLGALAQAGLDAGAAVARVTQPYRVRGARAPGSAERQDAAWLEIIAALRQRIPGVPLVQSGRSNGARVACRTAQAAGAVAVVALAFPLHPPGHPERSRALELEAAGTDVLVVNGASDPFGIPEPGGQVTVVVLPGETHALKGSSGDIRRIVAPWLSVRARRAG